VIDRVPWPNAGFMRRVYPGFIQLTGFMQMNLERHVEAHVKLFDHLVKGDCDSAQAHRKFYDEYLAVMDLPAEFYLETVRRVFQEHALPDGFMTHRGERVDCGAIRDVALMTVEGEKDDITGIGQCRAAQDLCSGIPDERKTHFECPKVGHYGVFNGSRFRREIAPRIADFTRLYDGRTARGVVSPPIERRAGLAPVVDSASEPSSAAFNFDTASAERHRHRPSQAEVAPTGLSVVPTA
jgi:poly(3-hydroxybutyrate) depolymerase